MSKYYCNIRRVTRQSRTQSILQTCKQCPPHNFLLSSQHLFYCTKNDATFFYTFKFLPNIGQFFFFRWVRILAKTSRLQTLSKILFEKSGNGLNSFCPVSSSITLDKKLSTYINRVRRIARRGSGVWTTSGVKIGRVNHILAVRFSKLLTKLGLRFQKATRNNYGTTK